MRLLALAPACASASMPATKSSTCRRACRGAQGGRGPCHWLLRHACVHTTAGGDVRPGCSGHLPDPIHLQETERTGSGRRRLRSTPGRLQGVWAAALCERGGRRVACVRVRAAGVEAPLLPPKHTSVNHPLRPGRSTATAPESPGCTAAVRARPPAAGAPAEAGGVGEMAWWLCWRMCVGGWPSRPLRPGPPPALFPTLAANLTDRAAHAALSIVSGPRRRTPGLGVHRQGWQW